MQELQNGLEAQGPWDEGICKGPAGVLCRTLKEDTRHAEENERLNQSPYTFYTHRHVMPECIRDGVMPQMKSNEHMAGQLQTSSEDVLRFEYDPRLSRFVGSPGLAKCAEYVVRLTGRGSSKSSMVGTEGTNIYCDIMIVRPLVDIGWV